MEFLRSLFSPGYSYRRILTGFVLAATMAGISVPIAAAIIAINTIRSVQDQFTSLGILLNKYTLLFQSFNPNIILIQSSIVLTFLVITYPRAVPMPEPTIPTQAPKPTKITATELLVAPQLLIIAMSFCLSLTIMENMQKTSRTTPKLTTPKISSNIPICFSYAAITRLCNCLAVLILVDVIKNGSASSCS